MDFFKDGEKMPRRSFFSFFLWIQKISKNHFFQLKNDESFYERVF